MSTKTFCDACGKELFRSDSDAVLYHIEAKSGGVCVEVQAGFNKLNEGELCKYCVIDAVARLDDRPKESQPR